MPLGLPTTGMMFFAWFIPVSIWILIWKGIALWKASRNNQMRWFVALIILNTVGILEIIYILKFQKKHKTAKFF